MSNLDRAANVNADSFVCVPCGIALTGCDAQDFCTWHMSVCGNCARENAVVTQLRDFVVPIQK